jgi:hypothetical protein
MFAASKTASVSGGYQISRSLRFNSADSAYLNRLPASVTNRKTYTYSTWIKRCSFGADRDVFGVRIDNSNAFRFSFDSSDNLDVYNIASGAITGRLTTTQVFRDPSAWYHFVLAIDTTNATAGNRMRLYVNGVEITTFITDTQPTQNSDTLVNTVNNQYIGYFSAATGNQYMTEINFVDGTQLTPSSFGETNAQTGVWQPKAYSGSYGTNGFYLNFSDNSNTTAATLGKDYSGNGNNWTPNNFSVTAGAGNDSLVDSPTSYGTDTGVGGTVRGNYATLNPLDTNATLSNGNLQAVVADSPSSDYLDAPCTIGISSGAFYFECVPTAITSNVWCGITNTSASGKNHTQVDASRLVYDSGGDIRDEAVTVTTVASYTTNDVISVAFDRDAGTVKFYKNGTQVYTVTNSKWQVDKKFLVAGRGTWVANFGQRPFAYTAPSGFKALCTQNLPVPSIGATTATQAGKYFNTVTYTGTGSSLGVTGVGFQPDWVWAKGRSGSTDHALYDAVRGVQKQLESNTTTAETTETTGLTAFNSDGFTTGALAQMNTSSATYVAWNWKANGSGSTNTAGSITSTVSANTTSGFSVVTYSGTSTNATVGHGLGVAPKMVIVKNRTSGIQEWPVYHSNLTSPSYYLFLNTTAAQALGSTIWNSSAPTSTVFNIGTAGVTNVSGDNYVAYCFAEVAGYSKFGSYTGNADTNGPFVYTGFRPAYVLIKVTSPIGNNWFIYDSTRSTSNLTQQPLLANATDTELNSSNYGIDLLSNGFKIRAIDTNINSSGANYIYMALASNPFKYSLAR